MKEILKGFRDFLMRGNVIELAVAVVIGAAFTAVVKAFSDFIINPLLAVFGGVNAAGFGFRITDNPKTFIDIGAVITASIQFVITAAVVYFIVVLPMKKAQERVQERLKKGEPEPESVLPPEPQIVLLTEIRDLLASGGAAGPNEAGDQPTAK